MNLKNTLATIFSCAILQVQAQQITPDTIQTDKGPLLIYPVTHASMVLTWQNKTIYVDPTGGAEAYNGLNAPDMVLITDIHGDHMDVKTLDAVNANKAILIAPKAVADALGDEYKNSVTMLANGKETTKLGVLIAAIPMYNLPDTTDARHPKGRGNGYVLNLGGKTLYIAGDTEGIPEMRSLKNIDVAFVPMNLPFTMDVAQAASAVLDFNPSIVYPYHYRGKNGLSDVAQFKTLVTTKNKNIDVRLKNWYPKQ